MCDKFTKGFLQTSRFENQEQMCSLYLVFEDKLHMVVASWVGDEVFSILSTMCVWECLIKVS